MANKFWGFFKGILLKKEASTVSYSAENEGAIYNHNNLKLRSHLAGSDREVVLGDLAQTLTNKTIDADSNTLTNIENADIKAAAAIDASKIADGSVSSVEFQYLSGVTSDVQSQLNSTASATALSDHINDTIDAHDASAISSVASGNLAATDVQAALNELQTDVDSRAASGDLTAHINDASDAHDASAISSVAAGNLAATDVQAALNELQTDVDTRATSANLTSHTSATSAHGVAGNIVGTSDTQTLTGKTIDGDDNTISDLALTSLKTALGDASKFVVRNASGVVVSNTKDVPAGVVVGTNDAQVLTAKDFDGGTASNTSRLSIPKNTKTNLDALTRKEATAVYATDVKKLFIDDGSVLLPVGSDGGGLDTFFTEAFEITVPTALASGNNSVFGGGGTFAGTLANETAVPLSGTRSLKVTQAAGSLNDYVELGTIALKPKQQATEIVARIPHRYNGAAGDWKFVARDHTNTVIVSSALDTLGSTTGISFGMYRLAVPANCTSLKIGVQVAVLNSAKILFIDDVELSTAPTVVTNISNTTPWETVTVTGSWVTNATYTAKRQYVGGSVVYDILVETSGEVTATPLSITLADTIDTSAMASAVANVYNRLGTSQVRDEGWASYADGSVYYGGGNTIFVAYKTGTTASADVTATAPFTFGATDKVRIRTYLIPTSNRPASISNVITPQTGDDSYVRVYTANGYGSTATKVRRFTTTADSSGPAITYADSAANGSTFTINTSGVYNVTYTDRLAAVGTIGISKNSAQLTTDISSITEATKLAQVTVGGSSYSSSCSWTGYLNIGDVVRPHGDGSASASDATIFSITKIGYKSLSAVPLRGIVVYTHTVGENDQGGTATSGSYQTRTLNTTTGDTSFSSLAANQVTLSPGTYDFSGFTFCYQVNTFKSRLQNITAGTTAIEGSSGNTDAGTAYVGDQSTVSGVVTVATSTVFELQQQVQTTQATYGLGLSSNFGGNNVYALLKITKVR